MNSLCGVRSLELDLQRDNLKDREVMSRGIDLMIAMARKIGDKEIGRLSMIRKVEKNWQS